MASSSLASTTSVTQATSSAAGGAAQGTYELAVKQLLWPVVVLSLGSPNFDLERTSVHQNEDAVVGGWLCHRSSSSKKKWHSARFYQLDSDALIAMHHSEVVAHIAYNKIISVAIFKLDEVGVGLGNGGGGGGGNAGGDAPTAAIMKPPPEVPPSPSRAKPRSNSKDSDAAPTTNTPRTTRSNSKDFPDAFGFRITYILHGGPVKIDLRPIDGCDFLLSTRWVAAIQLRAKICDPGLDADRAKALKAALWLQSLYRGSRARMVAQNLAQKRLRKTGISHRVRNLFSSAAPVEEASVSEESSSSENDDDEADPDFSAARGRPPANGGSEKSPLGRRFSFVKKTTVSKVEVEDELWENERWAAMAFRGQQMFRGWCVADDYFALPSFFLLVGSSFFLSFFLPSNNNNNNVRLGQNKKRSAAALLPTERANFSDRLGRGSWELVYTCL